MTDPEMLEGPEYEQANDTGLQCLLAMAAFHQIPADPKRLLHEMGSGAFDIERIRLAARLLGMEARNLAQDSERLDKAPLPAVAQDRDGRFFLLARFIPEATHQPDPNDPSAQAKRAGKKSALTGKVLVQYPGLSPETLPVTELMERWIGKVIYFNSKANYAGALAKFDFTWFIPAVIRYRHLLLEVLLLSLMIQIIGLVTPMFYQVVMDKVLVNNAQITLRVIGIGMIFMVLFEVIMTGVRSWVFAHTSSKIDVELGARLFRHLLNLPLSYFQSRRVGDSVARIRELENIRSFLTGNAITLVLDLLFSVIFIIVMLWYSPKLTLIVLISIPCYVVVSLVLTPVLRRRLDEKFNTNAENHSFLVESISGVDTVKAMAVEPRWIDRWDRLLARYVTAGLRVSNLGVAGNAAITIISKLVTVAIMWMGALEVIQHNLTVGELVAFNMLAGQVANPILRLAQMWNDFQQVGISMARLGDILNTHQEVEGQKTRLPRLDGRITIEQVHFRYRPENSDVLSNLNIDILPGEVIGVVGRSGSGKSTLAKLIQRLYVPDRGRILIDGQDISVIDTASLRQQIGVVLQENVLFNRSVRDNIALHNPALSLESIIEAARLSGAHEFICEMAEGYDTMVGEHGVGLSGGQRQRVAIARALISNPRILIFDEATSALDYESESIIQKNMKKIAVGRTLIIVAHRLSAVRHAHRIIVMDRGQIVEMGSHEELLQLPRGLYAHLNSLQAGGEVA